MTCKHLWEFTRYIQSYNYISADKGRIPSIYALIISANEYNMLINDMNDKAIQHLCVDFANQNKDNLSPYYTRLTPFLDIPLFIKNQIFNEERDRYMSEDRYKEIIKFISHKSSVIEEINRQNLFYNNPSEFQRVYSYLEQEEDRVINQNLGNHLISSY
jgi:hypothetical protein